MTATEQSVAIICACLPHIASQLQNLALKVSLSHKAPSSRSAWYRRHQSGDIELQSESNVKRSSGEPSQSNEHLKGDLDRASPRPSGRPHGLSWDVNQVVIRTDVECTAEHRRSSISGEWDSHFRFSEPG